MKVKISFVAFTLGVKPNKPYPNSRSWFTGFFPKYMRILGFKLMPWSILVNFYIWSEIDCQLHPFTCG